MRINLLHAHKPVTCAFTSCTCKVLIKSDSKVGISSLFIIQWHFLRQSCFIFTFLLFPFLSSCACEYNLAQFYRVISNHYEKRILLNFPCLFNVVLPFCHNVILSFSYIYLCTLQAPSRNKQLTFNCSPLCCMDNVKLLILTLKCSAYNHILHIVT